MSQKTDLSALVSSTYALCLSDEGMLSTRAHLLCCVAFHVMQWCMQTTSKYFEVKFLLENSKQ